MCHVPSSLLEKPTYTRINLFIILLYHKKIILYLKIHSTYPSCIKAWNSLPDNVKIISLLKPYFISNQQIVL